MTIANSPRDMIANMDNAGGQQGTGSQQGNSGTSSQQGHSGTSSQQGHSKDKKKSRS